MTTSMNRSDLINITIQLKGRAVIIKTWAPRGDIYCSELRNARWISVILVFFVGNLKNENDQSIKWNVLKSEIETSLFTTELLQMNSDQ